MRNCQIYKLINRVNGRIYIGQHFYTKLNDVYFCSSTEIHKEIRDKEFKRSDFIKYVLEDKLMTLDDADKLEIHYINKFDSFFFDNLNGYNRTRGGSQKWTRLGAKHTDEAKKKISGARKKMKGKTKPFTKSHRIKLSKASSGKNNSMYGKTGKDSPTFGRKRPQEEIDRISKGNKGKSQKNRTHKSYWMSKGYSEDNALEIIRKFYRNFLPC